MKKMLATLLAVVLLMLPLTGCYNPSTVLTVNGMDVSSGLYLYFQLQAVSEAAAKFENEYTGSELYSQTIDDTPARDWINNRTIEIAQEYVFIEQEYTRLEIDEEYHNYELSLYDSSIQSQWSQAASFYEKNGIGYQSFYSSYENYIKSNDIFGALYIEEDAEFAVPDAEVKEYFTENYTALDMIKISLKDEDGDPLSDSRKAEMTQLAADMKEYAESAVEELDHIYQDDTNIGLDAAFGLYTARENVSDADIDTVKSSILTKNAIVKSDSTSYDAELLKALFAASYEKFNVFEAEDAVYLYCRRDVLDYEPEKWKDYTSSIITTIRSDAFSEYLAEGSKALEVTEDARARKYYSLDKIVMS